MVTIELYFFFNVLKSSTGFLSLGFGLRPAGTSIYLRSSHSCHGLMAEWRNRS